MTHPIGDTYTGKRRRCTDSVGTKTTKTTKHQRHNVHYPRPEHAPISYFQVFSQHVFATRHSSAAGNTKHENNNRNKNNNNYHKPLPHLFAEACLDVDDTHGDAADPGAADHDRLTPAAQVLLVGAAVEEPGHPARSVAANLQQQSVRYPRENNIVKNGEKKRKLRTETYNSTSTRPFRSSTENAKTSTTLSHVSSRGTRASMPFDKSDRKSHHMAFMKTPRPPPQNYD